MKPFLARLAMNPYSLFAVFADAAAAPQWNPAHADKAQDVSGKFNVRKAKQAVLAVGATKGVALSVKALGVPAVDIWRTEEGVGLLDFVPAGKLPAKTDQATLKKLAAHLGALKASAKPRVAGTLVITSGMLAVFESHKAFPIARTKIAAGKPVEAKGAVAVPLENGTYDVICETLGPNAKNWHTDALGSYRRRIRIERT